MRKRKRQRALGPYPHRGSWHVIEVAADGSRTRVSHPTREEAVSYRDDFNAASNRGALTVREAIDKYRHHFLVGKGNKLNSWAETERRIVRLVGDPDLELDAVTPRRAAAMYDKLVGEMSADSHRGCLMHTRTFMKWCVRKGWIDADPFAAVEVQGRKRRGKQKLTRDEARLWMQTAMEWTGRGEWRALMASMTLMFGLRASEVLGLRVRDVDDNASLLRVEGTKSAAARRMLKIPDEMRDVLRLHVAVRVAEGGREARLFGEHDRRFVNAWVQEVCKAAGVRVVTAHGMRGTHAELATEEGVSPEALVRAMGHETFAVTAGHYVTGQAQAVAGQRRINETFGVIDGGKK